MPTFVSRFSHWTRHGSYRWAVYEQVCSACGSVGSITQEWIGTEWRYTDRCPQCGILDQYTLRPLGDGRFRRVPRVNGRVNGDAQQPARSS